MTVKQTNDYASAVYATILSGEPVPKDYRVKTDYNFPKKLFGRDGPNQTGIYYRPGQRPKGVVSDQATPDRKRFSFYEKGELTRREFIRQAATFRKHQPHVATAYMTHPRIIADIRAWFDDVRPVRGRYRTAKDAAVALQTYLRAQRWPVVVSAPLVERLFKLAGFEKNNYGWAVAFRYG